MAKQKVTRDEAFVRLAGLLERLTSKDELNINIPFEGVFVTSRENPNAKSTTEAIEKAIQKEYKELAINLRYSGKMFIKQEGDGNYRLCSADLNFALRFSAGNWTFVIERNSREPFLADISSSIVETDQMRFYVRIPEE